MGLTEKERYESMSASVSDGFFSAILFYLTSTFFGAFALALGADNTYIGLLASVPLIFWTVAQYPAAKAVDRNGNRKLITLASLAASRLLIIPLILLPTMHMANPLAFLIVFVSMSSFFNAFSNPSWASWIADIVPANIRGRFFSTRLRKYTAASIIALLFSAGVFTVFPKTDLGGFQLIFSVGAAAGIISLYFIYRMKDPGIESAHIASASSIMYFWKNRAMRKFILIFFVWQFGVTLSVPFYVVRLVKYLGAGYEWVSFQVILMSVSMLVFHKTWGRYLDRFGSRVVLSLCALGAAFYPFFWLFVRAPYQIIPIEIMSGIAWSGVNIAYFSYMLEISPSQKRHFHLALFYIVFGLAGILGPLAGSSISALSAGSSFLGFEGLEIVFFFSWLIRLAGAVMFIKFLDEIAIRQRVRASYVFGDLMKYGQKKALSAVYLTRSGSRKALSATKRRLKRVNMEKVSNAARKIKARRPSGRRRQVRP
ncbi:MAG: MFS transporter [Candidatus Aenigmarchaeota archaeon]|nr:MFS transporter [Candidatus Aenigmarchaeota archaeon]